MKMPRVYTFDVPDFDDCGGRTMRRVEVPKAVFRQIEADVAAPLEATIHQLGENAAKAAGEYAERVAAICKELALTELANIEGASDEWLAGFRHAVSRVEATLALDTLNVSNLARAALTEPTDG